MSNTNYTECRDEPILHVKAVTWHKDSHSLFDYQFNKNVNQITFDFSLTPKCVFMYRNNKNSQVIVEETENLVPKKIQNLQLLGGFTLRTINKKSKIQFHHASQFRPSKKLNQEGLLTQQSIQAETFDNRQQDIYLIVRSLKNKQNQNKGYKLETGQTIKLGRVQYKISSMKKDKQGGKQSILDTNSYFKNINTMECQVSMLAEDSQCKYCLQSQIQGLDNFFISPCKCSGSTGLVHFKCLEQWIQSKVKKQITGGTLHYNFEKFFCQLCKDQFPRFIKKGNNLYELMHIKKPQGSHMILQGVTEKTKNLMVIQNIPEEGIKIGRSHECQIRITDISVSRNHAYIQKINDDFYLFDSKSKFGSLVREQHLSFQLSRIKQGIQIGRTVFTFEITKRSSNLD